MLVADYASLKSINTNMHFISFNLNRKRTHCRYSFSLGNVTVIFFEELVPTNYEKLLFLETANALKRTPFRTKRRDAS